MPIAAIGGAISGVSSLVGGILGHNAASDAAAAQAKAAQSAATGQSQAGTNATNAIQGALSTATNTAAPYTSLGSTAAGELTNALAPSGSLTQGWNQTFQAPTAAQAQAQPGYQFSLQQGLQALQNSAAARGGLLSTGTAKNLTGYAEGLADTNYQNVFNNALQTYGTNFNTWNTNQNNLYNRLSGATGLGENAANNLNALQVGGNENIARNDISNAQLVGNDIMQVGNAQAAGIVGSTNALTQGIAGAGNALGQGLSLQSILGAQNASGTGAGWSPYSAAPPTMILNGALG